GKGGEYQFVCFVFFHPHGKFEIERCAVLVVLYKAWCLIVVIIDRGLFQCLSLCEWGPHWLIVPDKDGLVRSDPFFRQTLLWLVLNAEGACLQTGVLVQPAAYI